MIGNAYSRVFNCGTLNFQSMVVWRIPFLSKKSKKLYGRPWVKHVLLMRS